VSGGTGLGMIKSYVLVSTFYSPFGMPSHEQGGNQDTFSSIVLVKPTSSVVSLLVFRSCGLARRILLP
jgi:hypothetical protein